jgi:hypothetical protein
MLNGYNGRYDELRELDQEPDYRANAESRLKV